MKPSGIFIGFVGATIILAVCILVRVLKSIPSHKVKSGFTDKETEKEKKVIDEKPYTTQPIDSVDDYEYNLVFKGEGDKEMTKATRDILMSAYPKDWTTHPPSSELFQQGLAAYKEGFTVKEVNTNAYKEVDGSNMTPPDSKAAEDAERDILATYVPKKPGELTTYDLDDAEEIVKRIYTAKGLVAYTKRGENTITITGTSKIGEEIVYEDEDSGNQAPVNSVKDEVSVSMTNVRPKDPFFTVSQEDRTRDAKWDYTSWTPGLERMFAPTEPQKNWY